VKVPPNSVFLTDVHSRSVFARAGARLPSQSNEDVVQDGAPGGTLPLLASAQGDETPEREEGAFAQWVSL
jgi:hypothetical protein